MLINLDINKFKNINELIDSIIIFYDNNKKKLNDKAICNRRVVLSRLIEKFHIESGTITSKVNKKIIDLRSGNSIILMTAHQPNFLPYSGVLRKATLNYVIEKELEKRLGIKVINLYGIADQDFTDDRWVKSSLIPAITRKDGILNININLPDKIMINKVQKPSMDIIKNWKDLIETWLYDTTNSINNFCQENGIIKWNSKKSLLYSNFKNFWDIVEEAYKQATTYSDFNAFIISKIVNEVWGYDTLFSRFSDCNKIVIQEFYYLLDNFSNYSNSLEEIIKLLPDNEVKSGVSEIEPKLLPFWYHCNCGSKVRLFFRNQEDTIIGQGLCIRCKKEYKLNMGKVNDIDISDIVSNISARAISMLLVFSKGLGLSCYIGGIAGIPYLKETKYVADKLNIALPPIVVWRPQDKYLGIGQLEAILEYKKITGNYEINNWKEESKIINSRINKIYSKINRFEVEQNNLINKYKNKKIDKKTFQKEIKIFIDKKSDIKKQFKLSILNHDLKKLHNIPTTLQLIPSIIDYAINIGLRETSEQWIEYLKKNGNLQMNLYLKFVLNNLLEHKYFDKDAIFYG